MPNRRITRVAAAKQRTAAAVEARKSQSLRLRQQQQTKGNLTNKEKDDEEEDESAIKINANAPSSNKKQTIGGGRRPATTATITTEDSTNGNVNNNGRVNVNTRRSTSIGITNTPANFNSNLKQQEEAAVINKVNKVGCSAKNTLASNKTQQNKRNIKNYSKINSKKKEPEEEEEEEDFEEEEELQEAEQEINNSEDEEEDINLSAYEDANTDNSSSVVVINTIVKKSEVNREASESDDAGSSPGAGGSSEEEGPTSSECQSFYIIVNPDGSLVLDGTQQVQLVPGQERFPVSLPKKKVKSPTNPLPGAVPVVGQRARKSKPEGVTYGGSTDVGFISTPLPPISIPSAGVEIQLNEVELSEGRETGMSVGINPAPILQTSSTPGAPGPIDMDEFTNQLDPQSLATLETLIQSQQGREIIETLELDNHVATTNQQQQPVQLTDENNDSTADLQKPQKWDHSYTNNASGKDSSASSVTGSNVGGVLSPSSSVGGNSPRGSHNPGRSNRVGGSNRSLSASRLSEGDANIRRSQRQQDRIERQEAERILAENQQMLQREKEEIMKEANAQKAVAQSPVRIPETTIPQQIIPATPIAEPVPKAVDVPVTPVVLTPVAVRTGPPSMASSTRDSIDSSESDSRRPYPKRENRKLPAHLADPNYISLDDDGTKHLKDGGGALSEKGGGSRRSSTATKHEELLEESASIGNENSADDDDEDYTEDDPNRLWCICRQPHNNRFMICCDTCEEWFHGKCVNVTKAQGKAMELKNVLWNCPPCRKTLIEKAKKAAEVQKSTARAARRGSESTTPKSSPVVKLSKSAIAQQAEAAAAASASKMAVTPEKIAAQSTLLNKRGSIRRKDSIQPVESSESVQDCLVCGKPSRKDSIYCSDLCVQKYAENVGNKAAGTSGKLPPPATPTTPTTGSPTKLKRTNSLKPEQKSDEPIFAFHVITPGASKSTEIVPPKPKELTASQLLKAQREQVAAPVVSSSSSSKPSSTPPTQGSSPNPTVYGVSPNSVNAIISSTPTVVVKKMTTADGKTYAKLPGRISKETPLKMDVSNSEDKYKESPTKGGRNRTSSQSEAKSKPANNRKSERESIKSSKEKERDKEDSASSEKLHRENMRKGLRELLKARLKEMTPEEQKRIGDRTNTPEVLAEKIEDELCRHYGGANHPKCKAKYRSIYFNLKDSKNCMYQEILQGNLKPKTLVKMEPHEMASAELAEWRKKETQKEIEAIKKSELDKIAESKKIQLLEKGVDDAVNVAEELRPHDISDIIDSTSHKSDKKETEKEKHSSSSAADKSKSSSSHSSSRRDRDKETEKERERSDRRRSDRHKSSSDKHKESSSSSSSRDKNRRSTRDKGKESPKVKHSSDNKHNKDKRHSKGKDSEKQKSSSSTDEQSKSPVVTDSSKKQPEEVETTTAAESHPFAEVAISTPPPAEIKKVVEAVVDVRHSTDSEQELPSSTIKTPDFTDESGLVKKDADSKHLFQTKIVMPELGGFNASAHSVSHASIEGIFFPESPVPIVGRISPETVWDYINKMKKTKEVIVFRLSPATPADSEGYMTFFSYFSSRGRLGVMGGIISPLKDVYLVPLDKHSPVNRSLLPFRGPGLPEERTHCLLCVVTRNIKGDIASSIPLKRKSVLSEAQAIGKKKVKFGPETEKVAASHTSRQRPSSSSTTSSSKKLPPPLKKAKEDDDDDDAPYEPWEEDDDKVEVKEADAMPMALPPAAAEIVPDAVRQLQELEAQIAKEQQDIEKITGALAGRTNMSGIPGLDGEFAEGEEAEAQQAVAPFFRQESAPEEPTKVSQIEEAKEKVQISSTSKQSVIDVDDISSTSTSVEESSSEDTASSKKDNSPPETAVILEDSEEAYSPSAMQFSDEDSQGIEKEKEQVKEIPLEVVTKEKEAEEEEDEEQEPLPPGIEPMETVEKKQQQKPAVVVEKKTVEPVDDIKIVMKKPGFASTMASVNPEVSSSSPRKPSSSGTEMDVNDSFEPMIPLGNKLLKSTTETSKSETVFEKATGSVFGKPSASSASKMKININLITKQLPTENIQQQKSTEESQKAISLPTTTTVEPPPTQKQAIGVVSSPNINQSPIIPIHLPPPGLQQGPPPPNLQATLPNVHQPPPSLQPPPPHLHNLNQPPPIIPVHIPPPNMISAPTPPSSVVINLNVPPPPIMPMMSRPPMSQQSPSQAGGFHPLGPRPPMPGGGASFPNIRPPPPLNMRPGFEGSFAPTFGARPPGPGGANNMPPSHMPDTDREPMRGFDADGDVERVERINLDRERPDQRDSGFSGGRRENTRNMRGNMRGRDSRGRGRHGFGRRPFDRHSDRGTERVRRRRSKSEDRSRSRSPRDRRHRKRHSKSRSKSPLSRRWEARNRSRSRSIGSIGKRNRHRSSKSPSPSGRRRRVSRSPRRNPRRGRSHSKSNSPPLPSRTRNESKDSSEINRKPENHEEDWESSFEELGENKNEPQSSSSNIIESNNIIPGKIV